MTLETNQKIIQEQLDKEREALYKKLMQERYEIPTREDSIQQNSQE